MALNTSISRFSQELMESISYIHSMARLMLKSRCDALIEGKVTIPQYLTLELLDKHALLKMHDIAKALQITLPAATGLINRLVRMKLVKRASDPNDRRVVYVELSPEGKKTTQGTKRTRRKVIEEIFGSLTECERQAYLTIIRKVKSNLYEKTRKSEK